MYILLLLFSSLSDDRSKASSKTIPPHSAIESLLLQMRVSSPVLKVIQQLLTSSSPSSCHIHLSLYLSFDNFDNFGYTCEKISKATVGKSDGTPSGKQAVATGGACHCGYRAYMLVGFSYLHKDFSIFITLSGVHRPIHITSSTDFSLLHL